MALGGPGAACEGEGRAVSGPAAGPMCPRAPRFFSLGFFLVWTVKGWSVGWGFLSFSVSGIDGPFPPRVSDSLNTLKKINSFSYFSLSRNC